MKGCCVSPYDAQGRQAADVRAGSNRIDQKAAVLGSFQWQPRKAVKRSRGDNVGYTTVAGGAPSRCNQTSGLQPKDRSLRPSQQREKGAPPSAVETRRHSPGSGSGNGSLAVSCGIGHGDTAAGATTPCSGSSTPSSNNAVWTTLAAADRFGSGGQITHEGAWNECSGDPCGALAQLRRRSAALRRGGAG
jgi:hypothetical protein